MLIFLILTCRRRRSNQFGDELFPGKRRRGCRLAAGQEESEQHAAGAEESANDPVPRPRSGKRLRRRSRRDGAEHVGRQAVRRTGNGNQLQGDRLVQDEGAHRDDEGGGTAENDEREVTL